MSDRLTSADIIRLPIIPRREATQALCTFNTPAVLRKTASETGTARIRAIAKRSAARRKAAHYEALAKLCATIDAAAREALSVADCPGEIDNLESLRACYSEDQRHYGLLVARYAKEAAEISQALTQSADQAPVLSAGEAAGVAMISPHDDAPAAFLSSAAPNRDGAA